MQYTSTRDHTLRVSASQAITQGISQDGGLFIPESIPELSRKDWDDLLPLGYVDRAVQILSLFLTDFTQEEIRRCAENAYTNSKFDDASIVPLKPFPGHLHVLELWHGPTCAFKDMALQILPHLLRCAAQKIGDTRKIVILVATSGDTGKAALEGFQDVESTEILVFYPNHGVSAMQELQMVTQEGRNVHACAIEGNFDDAQTSVKRLFTDRTVADALNRNHMVFSSANSINWGRLVPQVVYYISAYCDLLKSGALTFGEKINIVVPTGNFGNILAAYYARRMGLPVNKLICASNSNNVLTDFITTGYYDRNRDFFTTISPSMDILISSNLERLLFLLARGDSDKVNGWMQDLSEKGCYRVDDSVLSELQSLFAAGYATEAQTQEALRQTFQESGYLLDPHTAVGMSVWKRYEAESGDHTRTVLASTASPYKFGGSVLSSLGLRPEEGADEFATLRFLQQKTGAPIPEPLLSLQQKSVRFQDVCNQNTMQQYVFDVLGIE